MLLQDLTYAARGLRHNPVFTIVAVLSLAIGIGANCAIFTLLDQLLLRSLPLPEPHRLVQLDLPGPRQGMTWNNRPFSYPMYREIRDAAGAPFEAAAQFLGNASLSTGDRSQVVAALLVSGNWFSTMGVNLYLGRPIGPEDDRTVDGHPVVVLTHAFWQRRFGSDRSIVGKKILMNGQPMAVIGVTQPGFRGTDLMNPPDLFLPVAMQRVVMPNAARLEDRFLFFLHVFIRLRPEASAEQAKSVLDATIAPILLEEMKQRQFPSEASRTRYKNKRFRLYPAAHGNLSGEEDVRTVMWLLTALVSGVLLIACANVANLMLARSTARRREIAVRLAMGASRWQLARMVLTESVLLSLIGGGIGLLAAYWATDALLLFANPAGSQVLPLETAPDFRVVLFTAGLSMLTGIVFGLAPALASTRPDVAPTLKDETGSISNSSAASWLRKGLVVSQVALSLLLLAAASLFLTTLHNLRTRNPGFEADHLLVFSVNPSMNGYSKESATRMLDKLTEELSALPAVNEVTMAAQALLSDSQNQATITVAGYQHGPDEDMNPLINDVGPGFLHTLRIPLLQGRDFTAADTADSPKVAIVSETFARMYFKGQSAIGHKIGYRRDALPATTIIGVAKDIQHLDMREERSRRQILFPSSQALSIESRTFYLRTPVPLERLAPAIRAIVRKQDPSLAVDGMRTMREQIDVSLTMERLVSALCTAFGLIATVLAGVGLYGVMAFHVARRTREIGIRMALGAQRADVHRMVLREAGLLAVGGVLAGIPLALAVSRWSKTLLFGIEPTDPWIYAGTAVFLLAIALLASFLPARRASRIDPMQSLRY